MPAEKWLQVKEILDAAIRQKPEDRAAFLDEACDGNETVRWEVESLLSSFGKADGFMEQPAVGHAARELTVEMTPLPGGLVIGDYEIIRRLGEGGMGVVYLAKDQKLDRLVAIKVLNKRYERHEENVRRFVQEAKAASALNHPNILTIHQIGEFEGSQYIVSEFVDGATLRDTLKEANLDISVVIDVATQIAGALAAAHSAKIIHRDIKPENIVVRDDGYVKVLDFGLAKLLPSQVSTIGLDDRTKKQNETAKGVILGTVSYMSPEQAKGEPVDERTDIFSLGVVMYEMIASRTPFAGNSTPETFANLINKQPEPLERIAREVPAGLSSIVERMLEKDQRDRYQTMTEVVAELKSLRDGDTRSDRRRISSPNEETLTEALTHTTAGEAVKDAGRTSGSQRSSYRRVAFLTLIPLALIAAAVAAWFLYPVNTQSQIKTLAVLPLKSLEAQDNFLGFGIADAVIRRISQTGALTVRPTSAVKRYVTEDTDALTAAQQLTVDAVLEGTVQRDGERVRITVNLLRTADGASLWAERFDAQLTDIFAVQDKVAQQVATRLQLQLDPAQQARLAKRTTSDPVAYENYVKGVFAFNQRRFDETAREQIDSTIGFLKTATDLDPKYALAHAKLAHAYAWKGLFIVTEDQERLLQLAREEIETADALDPQLAETHLARFRILFSEPGGWRIEDAARACLTAQQIDPNTGHEEASDVYLHMGLEDLMDREIRKALEIDPTSEWVKLQLFIYYQILNRYDDYLRVRNEYFPEEPISPAYYLEKNDFAKTRELLDEADKKDPRGADPVLRSMLYAREGNVRASEALLPTIFKEVNAQRMKPSYHHHTYDIACIYAVNGNAPEAVKWLRETAAKGNPSYTMFTRDIFLDKIRQSPEFIRFMAELKPQYERYRSEFR
jgi:serine/threonine protein kinase/tetratricopeptide (TPR) repeat protein